MLGVVRALLEECDIPVLVMPNAGLPELDADEYFYEGWIVRKGADFSVISTGPVEYDAKLAQWVNKYQSEQDLTDHLQYVLTLEPNDNDPAPAAHVLDGVMEPLEMN